MSKAAQLALLSMVGLMSGPQVEQPTQIRSYKIKQKKEETQLSKQEFQRMKGKKARRNRGKNRSKNLGWPYLPAIYKIPPKKKKGDRPLFIKPKNKPQDTPLYASLRR